jgi:hypothetical protein
MRTIENSGLTVNSGLAVLSRIPVRSFLTDAAGLSLRSWQSFFATNTISARRTHFAQLARLTGVTGNTGIAYKIEV